MGKAVPWAAEQLTASSAADAASALAMHPCHTQSEIAFRPHALHAVPWYDQPLTFLTARFMSVFGELTVEACATRGPRASKVSQLVCAYGRTTATWPVGQHPEGKGAGRALGCRLQGEGRRRPRYSSTHRPSHAWWCAVLPLSE